MASAGTCFAGSEGIFAAGAAFPAGLEWEKTSQSNFLSDDPIDSIPDDHKLTAFIHAAENHRNQLMWLALRMTHSYEDAEDVVQRALLKGFKNLDRFRGDSQMTTWLGVIVQNTARELLRTQKGKIHLALDQATDSEGESLAFDLPDPGKNPEEHCMSRQMEQMIVDAIERIGGENQRALQLCALEEMSYLTAAKILNVQISTVKSRVFRGKQILKLEMRTRQATRTQAKERLTGIDVRQLSWSSTEEV